MGTYLDQKSDLTGMPPIKIGSLLLVILQDYFKCNRNYKKFQIPKIQKSISVQFFNKSEQGGFFMKSNKRTLYVYQRHKSTYDPFRIFFFIPGQKLSLRSVFRNAFYSFKFCLKVISQRVKMQYLSHEHFFSRRTMT